MANLKFLLTLPMLLVHSELARGNEVLTSIAVGGGAAIPLCTILASSPTERCTARLLPRASAGIEMLAAFENGPSASTGLALRQGF
jgi:hypothetical protein